MGEIKVEEVVGDISIQRDIEPDGTGSEVVCEKLGDNIEDILEREMIIDTEDGGKLLLILGALSRDNRLQKGGDRSKLLELHHKVISLLSDRGFDFSQLQSLSEKIGENVMYPIERNEMRESCKELGIDYNEFHKEMTNFFVS